MSNGGKKICSHFRKFGSCDYGDDCRYDHPEKQICTHHIIGKCAYPGCYKIHLCMDFYNNSSCECNDVSIDHLTQEEVNNKIDENSRTIIKKNSRTIIKKKNPVIGKIRIVKKDALSEESKEDSKEKSFENKKSEIIKIIEDIKDPHNLNNVYDIIKVLVK